MGWQNMGKRRGGGEWNQPVREKEAWLTGVTGEEKVDKLPVKEEFSEAVKKPEV